MTERPIVLVVASTFQHFLLAGWTHLLPPSDEACLYFIHTRELERLEVYEPETTVYLVLPLVHRSPTIAQVKKALDRFIDVMVVSP